MASTWRDLKSRLRATLEAADRRRLLAGVQARGRAALRGLTAAQGPLDPTLARQARDYAGDVLGSTRHAVWLKVFSAVQGQFREGWLPDSYFAEHVRPRVNGTYRRMTRYRAANGLFFPSDTLPDVARMANGLVLGACGKPTSAAEIAAQARAGDFGLIFKSDSSSAGLGLQMIDAAMLDDALLARLGNGVLQRRLHPHAAFAPFGVKALATLRVATAVDDKTRPLAVSTYMKFGRVNDSHVQADDYIRLPVDAKTGEVDKTGYTTTWQPLRAHPDTAAEFAGTVVPRVPDCVARAVALHKLVPMVRYVCWDFAIDSNAEIHLLEWEGGVANFAEATQGPCFLGLGWDRFHLD